MLPLRLQRIMLEPHYFFHVGKIGAHRLQSKIEIQKSKIHGWTNNLARFILPSDVLFYVQYDVHYLLAVMRLGVFILLLCLYAGCTTSRPVVSAGLVATPVVSKAVQTPFS